MGQPGGDQDGSEQTRPVYGLHRTGQVTNFRATVEEEWQYLKNAARSAQDSGTLELMERIGQPDPLDPVQFGSWRSILNRKYLGAADASGCRAYAQSPSV
jgi:hypothetical protein